MRVRWIIVCCFLSGCGTTRWSDTKRTATEQMLVSDAVERAISQIDFHVLTDQEVYLETKYLQDVTDKDFIISTLRQYMLASGCVLKEKREEAAYIIEARAGAVGTNRHDLLWGIPSMNLPTVSLTGSTVPNSIPEIALAKRTNQEAVAKLAVFAYERSTGRPVWQSGNEKIASQARDLWMFGAGPFQNGTIYEGPKFAGGKMPLVADDPSRAPHKPAVAIAREAIFADPQDRNRERRLATEETAVLPGETFSTADQHSPTWRLY